MTEVSILRIWVWLSAVIAVSFLIWTFVPILIPFGVVVAVLGTFAYGVRCLGRMAAQRREKD